MTYFPLAETHDTGTAYFESIGLIGGSTGMVPLVTGATTFPTPDAVTASPPTITDSVCKWIAGNSDSGIAWDFPSAISKGLAITYVTQCTGYARMEFSNDAAGTSFPDHYYEAQYHGNGNATKILKQNPSLTYTVLATETTIYQENNVTQPFWGLGLYVDGSGSDSVVKVFVKSGISQWIEVLSATDSSGATEISTFNSFCLANFNNNSRNVTPLMVWGVA
jgi:hypothetical protein